MRSFYYSKTQADEILKESLKNIKAINKSGNPKNSIPSYEKYVHHKGGRFQYTEESANASKPDSFDKYPDMKLVFRGRPNCVEVNYLG